MENNTQQLWGGPNSSATIRLGLIFALVLFFASLAPAPLIAATLSGLLNSAALINAFLAALARQPFWADRLTRGSPDSMG